MNENFEKFRQDNTVGFTDEQLDEMNIEYNALETGDIQIDKHIAEKILGKY